MVYTTFKILSAATALATATAALAFPVGPRAQPQRSPVPFEGTEGLNLTADPARFEEAWTIYLRRLAPTLGPGGLPQGALKPFDEKVPARILTRWLNSSQLITFGRKLLEDLTHTNGRYEQGVDMNMASRLMEHVIDDDHPLQHLLTADYCVHDNNKKGRCDSKAPYNAGILTSSAFLRRSTSRFNLHRATVLMQAFLCTNHTEGLWGRQPPVPREELIDIFGKELPPEEAALFKGAACHSCHGLFAQHTQLFVRLSAAGLYNEKASGIQHPNLGPGNAKEKDMYTSHFRNAKRARLENANFFGHEVANLREAALVLVEQPEFYSCMVQNMSHHLLGLDFKDDSIPPKLYEEVAEKARTTPSFSPTWKQRKLKAPGFKDLLFELLTHQGFIASVLAAEGFAVTTIARLGEEENLQEHLAAIMSANCQGCHNGPAGAGGIDLSAVGGPSESRSAKGPLIVPGKPEASRLYLSIHEGTMPPTGRLTDDEMKTVADWIRSLKEPSS